MSTLGTSVLNADDIKKLIGPDGRTLNIAEVLFLDNQILNDIRWKEGNLPTGNLTGIRSSIPTPSIRMLNSGVVKTKSTTKQVTDTCCILEDNSEVDEEVLALASDKEGVRMAEDRAHAEGFRQSVGEMIFYGDSDAEAGEFNGLHVRFNDITTTKGEPGYQIISGGGSGSDNTSAWFIDWSENGVVGIYPKGSMAGLQTRDAGRLRVEDASHNPYYAWCTNMKWKVGLAVQDYRKVARLANIDVSDLPTSTTLIKNLILAQNRIHMMSSGTVLYVNEGLYSQLQLQLMDKANVYITRQELMNKAPQLYFNGVPVRKCDAILNSEATIS